MNKKILISILAVVVLAFVYTDVAAGMGKAFNEACFNRIGSNAHHDDGNRRGRILGRPNLRVPS
jgi:hypothetical protein